MAVPMGSFPGGVILGGFRCHVVSFRVAGVALRDMWTCLVTCRNSFCVAGAILSRRLQNMRCIFSWQAQHFGRVHLHFSWQGQHFRRAVLHISRESYWQGSTKWGQSANCVADVEFWEM